MALASGSKLGQYEIVGPLGAGGMGEVYRARDSRLGRAVAIKVLPSFLSADSDQLRRFEQEARAAAALNHPNILAVFQMGTYEGAPYLVSELLEGETLREQIKRGRLPIRKAIDYAVQIARGLAAAHDKGIVHRDLKPENLFVTKDGRLKILDFGLAKLMQPQSGSDETELTLTTGTEAGMVMGTVGYMSPEQVRGQTADHRADVFAFGAILYEMLAGKRAFQKPTSAETMAAILNEDPPGISQVTTNIPPALQRVVHRCLEKSPEQRFQSASDLAFALDALSESAGTATVGETGAVNAVAPVVSGKFRWLGLLGAVVAILAIAATFAWLRLPQTPPRVLAITQLTKDGVPKAGLLTDGSRLYIEESRGTNNFLVQAAATGGETSPIPTPFPAISLLDISPDHSQLMVLNIVNNIGPAEFWALPLPSGPPRRIADVTGSDGKWSPDGRQLVFARGDNIYLAKADGTDARKLFTVAHGASGFKFSPDSTRIRFHGWNEKENSYSIWEIRTDGTNLHPLLPGWRNPASECCGVWSPDGRYFFFLSDNASRRDIWALQESNTKFRKYPSRLFQLTAGPLRFSSIKPSPDGKKLFAEGYQARGELIRYDAQRGEFVPFLSGMWASDLNFSTDGKWVAYVSYPDATLWRSRVDGSDRMQLTSPPVVAALPRWSPDGTQIAFMDIQKGRAWKIWLISATGGAAQEMLAENLYQVDAHWSPDGKQMVFGRSPTENNTIQLLDLNSKQVSIIPGSQGLYSPRWCPDGRHLAALTDTDRKIVVFDFKRQTWSNWFSGTGLLSYPAWSRDGRYLYFEISGTETPGYYRIQLEQNHPELVVDLKDLHQYATFGSPWSGITPDGSPLFVRDTSMDEIYSLDLELP